MQNPFTTTFNKMPEYTYIATEQTREILDNFSYSKPSESVYKITGVRGSGKTVILAKIEEELRKGKFREDGWCVCDLNPARDILMQFRENKYGQTSFRVYSGDKKLFTIDEMTENMYTFYFWAQKNNVEIEHVKSKHVI